MGFAGGGGGGSRCGSLLVSERAGFSTIGEPSDGTFSSVKRTCRPAQPSPEQTDPAVGNSRIVLSADLPSLVTPAPGARRGVRGMRPAGQNNRSTKRSGSHYLVPNDSEGITDGPSEVGEIVSSLDGLSVAENVDCHQGRVPSSGDAGRDMHMNSVPSRDVTGEASGLTEAGGGGGAVFSQLVKKSPRGSLLVSERAGFSTTGEPSDGTFSSVKRMRYGSDMSSGSAVHRADGPGCRELSDCVKWGLDVIGYSSSWSSAGRERNATCWVK